MGTDIRDLMPGELVYSLFRYENVNEGISLKNRPRPDENQNILPSRQIIIDRISKDVINALKNGQKIKHFLLRSNFGVGKSYVLENIVTKCVNCKIDGANVLHFAVNKECGLESMYQMFSAVGFSLDLVKESAVLERKSNTTQREKAIIKIMRKIQLISVDDANACSWEIWNFLSKVSKEQSLKTVILGSASLLQKLQDDQSIRYFEIPELTSNEAEAWIREHRGAEKGVEIKLDKEGSIGYNPVCLLLRMKIQALPGIDVSIAVNDSLEDILTKIFRTLPSAELYLLSQFALCRKPIPLKSERDVENLIRIGLVQLKKGERCNSIVLQPCIKVLVSKMINKENLEVDGQQKKDFSVIALWRNLLHPKLQELLTGAEQRKWPYIPEPW
ncbi:MAG: hypothetical protein CMB97_01415 [Flavobacteriaceae bacterium]|nr:hypothetical protein [Flavobacteriaceae bacterium]